MEKGKETSEIDRLRAELGKARRELEGFKQWRFIVELKFREVQQLLNEPPYKFIPVPKIVSIEWLESMVGADTLNDSIDELEVSVRSYNRLKDANIKTVGELAMKTEAELGFGKTIMADLRDSLAKLGIPNPLR